jgi:predicted dehydrogenase
MKVGIIGCGGIAPYHIGSYKKIRDVEIVGLCDLNIERANVLAKKFNIENTYSNYWDMFEKGLDYVDICTPVSTHAKIVCDAAEAVPSILVEKPMALSVAQCDEMIKKIHKTGTNLCIGHTQLFSEHIQKAKRIVDNENFNLHAFSTTLKANFETMRKFDYVPPWNITPEQGGIIWEVCAHHAYLQLHFLPDIKEVYAVGGKVKYPVFDDFAVLLRTESDSFGIIELSWVLREFEVVYELRNAAGRRIKIFWEHDYMTELSEEPPFTVPSVARNIYVDEKRLLQKWIRFGTCSLKKRRLLPSFNLITQYIESIRKDLPPPVTPEQGRQTINLLESIKKSLTEKKPVRLKK